MQQIQMADLKGQYLRIKEEIDTAIQDCIDSAAFINGPQVQAFREALAKYLDVDRVVTCGNGTDALQLALMSLDLQAGDEVIIPAFSYAAAAEVVCLLGLVPVMIDVDPGTFNIKPAEIEEAIGPKTKAIIAVHLFGQCTDMEPLMQIAEKHSLFVIEDNAQALGSEYVFSDGTVKKSGTIGHVGCTSFFPSKNLGCYGDGGAVSANDETLSARLQMMANHGQEKKYIHKYLGINSRLDTIQAAILNVKLNFLDEYCNSRREAAQYYDKRLSMVEGIIIPERSEKTRHVFHQYTIKVKSGKRDALKAFLQSKGIPSMIYYPLPLNQQEAYKEKIRIVGDLKIAEELCDSVLSLPMHTEMTQDIQDAVTNAIVEFYKN